MCYSFFIGTSFVLCRDCEAQGPVRKTERGAINAFNRRANDE